MKRLLLDLGNTRMKWCVAESLGDVTCQGRVPYGELAQFLNEDMANHVFDGGVWLGSVGNHEHAQAIQSAFSHADVHALSSPVSRAGVTNSYAQPERLGVDRWFGIVAATHCFDSPTMVVDAGTALTIDVVDKGLHQGGFIVPGLRMMRTSLSTSTALLPEVTQHGQGLGCSTETAIAHGTLHMLSDFVSAQYYALIQQFPGLQCVLTGGDAELMYNTLQIPLVKDADWVLKGIWFESEFGLLGRANEK